MIKNSAPRGVLFYFRHRGIINIISGKHDERKAIILTKDNKKDIIIIREVNFLTDINQLIEGIEGRLKTVEQKLELLTENKEIYLTLDVAANELSKSELTLRRWVQEGKVNPVLTPKGQMLFTLNQINELSEELQVVSSYGLKILYSDWPRKAPERVAFPKNRYNIAKSMQPGMMCLIYLTHPIKRIVTVTKITGTIEAGAKKWPNQEQEYPRWPYVVPHKKTVGFKEGLTLKEAGIDFRPRPGDTYLNLDKETFDRIVNTLQEQPDYDWSKWLEMYGDDYSDSNKQCQPAGCKEGAQNAL